VLNIADRYAAVKTAMSQVTGAQEDLLHVHFGLLIFVVAAVALGKRLHSPVPVLVVWAFAVTNEVVDYFASRWQIDASTLDILNTVIWPTVIYFVARYRSARAISQPTAVAAE
jgi:hypothetical protein